MSSRSEAGRKAANTTRQRRREREHSFRVALCAARDKLLGRRPHLTPERVLELVNAALWKLGVHDAGPD